MFDLDPTLLSQVNNADFSANRGGLPFPARHFYALNGDARMANAGVPAMFFGGFATDKADWDNYLGQSGLKQLSGMTVGTISGRDSNGAVEIYTARSLYIAPVAMRTAWLVDNGKRRVNEYQPGARRHSQMLVVLADKNEDGALAIHGPAVLTAKGFQANNLIGAIDAWTKHTSSIRSQAAPGVPAWLFWLAIGTFGNQRVVDMVGGAQKSPITPIHAYLPEPMTEEILTKTYGGEALARMIVDLRGKAQDWTLAWSQPDEGPTKPAGRTPNFNAAPAGNMGGDDTIF